jgi:hypothetical protein
MKRLLCVLFLLAACNSDPEPADKLQGSWLFELNTLEAFAITFKGAEYEFDDIAVLEDGTVGMFVELGTFDATANVVTFRPSRASCSGAFPDYNVNYNVDATRLSLLGNAQITTFVKFTPTGSGGGSSARIGCFFDDGSFTQQPIGGV